MKVIVALYEHRHGTDVVVFDSEEKAEAWRAEIAEQYWDHCEFENDPAFNVDLYWDEMNEAGREWFSYEWYEVQ